MFELAKFKNYSELVSAFPSEKECFAYLETIRWNGNVVSPFEPASKVYKCAGTKYKCKTTGKYFNVLSGTVFENTKIPLQIWFQAIFYCLTIPNGISSYGLAKVIGKSQKTCWFILSRLRYIMDNESSATQFHGSIEIDETYIGGKNINRHKNKKVANSQGRSTKDKELVIGLFQNEVSEVITRPSKNNPERMVKEKVILQPAIVRTQVIPNATTNVMLPIIYDKVATDSIITTDEHRSYTQLHKLYNHELVFHRMKQYVNYDGYTTNHIEGYWNIFKRVWRSTYMGRITAKHLHRYCREVEYKFNTRHLAVSERFNLLMEGFKKRLRYTDLKNNK